ncbi:MAG TPA: hypothetical protein DDY68_01865 [Porphyromonadaceae bacterium]|nr:hypothetical protein [Porphyromonadaceae bacterium]
MQRKNLFFCIVFLFCVNCSQNLSSQKYAFVDMEYILRNVPSYEMANDQLNQVSKKYQSEVDVMFRKVQEMYKKYQSEMPFLTDEMKTQREQAIVSKETEAKQLQKKYFGTDGELFKKRKDLITPIQEEVYNAIRSIAELKGYSMIIDRSSSQNIIYMSPKIDISNDVLIKLGYMK